MLDENLLLCKKEPAIMFVLKHNRNLGSGGYPFSEGIFEYTYTDPSTKQTVTKLVNSTNNEYVFPCAIGDTVKFSNLIFREPSLSGRHGSGALFSHGVDVSPTALYDFAYSFRVTVTGSSPYIEHYFLEK